MTCFDGVFGTAELAFSLFPLGEKDGYLLNLVSFLDESGTHGQGAPVTVMGGYVGQVEGFIALEPQLKKLWKKYRIDVLHGSKLYASKKDFEGWTLDRKSQFVGELYSEIYGNILFSFANAVSNEAYDKFVKSKRIARAPSTYGHCAAQCFTGIPEMLSVMGIRGARIKYILESGHKNAGDALRMHGITKGTGSTITFAGKREYLGLQVADLLVYLTYRHLSLFPESAQVTSPDKLFKALRGNLTRSEIFIPSYAIEELGEQYIQINKKMKKWGTRKISIS